jgi:hypothetical protein
MVFLTEVRTAFSACIHRRAIRCNDCRCCAALRQKFCEGAVSTDELYTWKKEFFATFVEGNVAVAVLVKYECAVDVWVNKATNALSCYVATDVLVVIALSFSFSEFGQVSSNLLSSASVVAEFVELECSLSWREV